MSEFNKLLESIRAGKKLQESGHNSNALSEIFNINEASRTLLKCDKSVSGEVVIPEGILTINSLAFIDCNEITSISIPDSIKTIKKYAFAGCSRLKSVIIGKGITDMEELIFSGCRSLSEIKINLTMKECLERKKKFKWQWREESFISKIICTDGVIELN